MVLEINSKDYSGLKTDYSDQNIINRVQGSEFLIDNASVVDFYFNGNPSLKEYEIIPTIPPSTNNIKFSFRRLIGLGTPYGRVEGKTLKGTFTAEVEDVIYDKDNISVDYEIDYDSYFYSGKIINEENCGSDTFIYNSIRNNNNLVNKDNENIRYAQTKTNSNFEMNDARIGIHFIANTDIYAKINLEIKSPMVTNVYVDSITGKTIINAEFEIPIWYGYSDYVWRIFSPTYDNHLNVVRSIKFKVRANTINITENTFDYGNFNEDPYALESNEFLQYENGELVEDRMSYETGEEIFEKTERNRMLVSFNLFRLDKLDWGGDGNLRFIRSRDRIKIKDELGNYLGVYYDDSGNEIIPEFEVVRANGKWDGKFYKEIIAKQVYIDS